MKQKERNTLSRQRILQAALQEFSERGYAAASLNTVCTENNISKGIIYHYFADKDQLYLSCVTDFFDTLTAFLTQAAGEISGSLEQKLQNYFDARLRFFSEHPLYLGLFAHAALDPPPHLSSQIAQARKNFDDLNISLLTELLNSAQLRNDLSVCAVVNDFRDYMDYFNLRFKDILAEGCSPRQALCDHEERCHRQLNMLLYGVLGD